jgi:hypothetical protein
MYALSAPISQTDAMVLKHATLRQEVVKTCHVIHLVIGVLSVIILHTVDQQETELKESVITAQLVIAKLITFVM